MRWGRANLSGRRVTLPTTIRDEYRTTLAGPYIIYYRYNATTLTVYRIMHQRQSIDTYSLIEY
ncbi:MAG: hypothetical protein ACLUW6_10435 [Coriobacteriaceae bacterium]